MRPLFAGTMAGIVAAALGAAGCLEPFSVTTGKDNKPAATLDGVQTEAIARSTSFSGYRAEYVLRWGEVRKTMTVRFLRPGLYRMERPEDEVVVVVGRRFITVMNKGKLKRRLSIEKLTKALASAEAELRSFAEALGRPRYKAGLGVPFGTFADYMPPRRVGEPFDLEVFPNNISRALWAFRIAGVENTKVQSDGESYTLACKGRRLRISRRHGLLLSDEHLDDKGKVIAEQRLLAFHEELPGEKRFVETPTPTSLVVRPYQKEEAWKLVYKLIHPIARMEQGLKRHWRSLSEAQKDRLEELLTAALKRRLSRNKGFMEAYKDFSIPMAPLCKELRKQSRMEREAGLRKVREGFAKQLRPMMRLLGSAILAKAKTKKGKSVEEDARFELFKRALRTAVGDLSSKQLARYVAQGIKRCDEPKATSRPASAPASKPAAK